MSGEITPRWRHANGTETEIHALTDAHLGNALRYLKKYTISKICKISFEGSPWWKDHVSPIFFHLEREAEARHMQWEVISGVVSGTRTCQMPIDDKFCTAEAVMWTAPVNGIQEFRCATHRNDKSDDDRMSCDWCFQRTNEIVAIRRGDAICRTCETLRADLRARRRNRILQILVGMLAVLSSGKANVVNWAKAPIEARRQRKLKRGLSQGDYGDRS